jgi:hypothetical protein
MVARRSGNDSTLLLVTRQLCQRIARSPFLKASRALQVVELAENFHPGDVAQRNGGRTRGTINRVRNSFARSFDVLKCDQAFNSRVLPAQLLIVQLESGTGCNLRNPTPAGDRI